MDSFLSIVFLLLWSGACREPCFGCARACVVCGGLCCAPAEREEAEVRHGDLRSLCDGREL